MMPCTAAITLNPLKWVVSALNYQNPIFSWATDFLTDRHPSFKSEQCTLLRKYNLDNFQVFVCSAQLMIDSCSSESEFQHLGAVHQPRHHRSLVNSFPFNQASLEQPSPREVKQAGDDVRTDFESVARSERCIDKVEMEERTEYDEVTPALCR